MIVAKIKIWSELECDTWITLHYHNNGHVQKRKSNILFSSVKGRFTWKPYWFYVLLSKEEDKRTFNFKIKYLGNIVLNLSDILLGLATGFCPISKERTEPSI
eukprot:TRINITY_DN10967_c0_g1_i1.p2 TRINITY_DN10967_c0_g1~~TRINITY_DN10967_c0_g1_i1.p2  ORF type:complete len:102 (+),score=14.50 TRINITY_DN10967_c0_g1_i1:648-953(+)